MSQTEKIELSIFNPFSEYFKILYNVCGTFDQACINTKFVDIITKKCDACGNETPDELGTTFKKALKLFVLNLKSFDSPISEITIKGQLYDIFLEAFKTNGFKLDGTQPASTLIDPTNKADIIKNIVDKVNAAKMGFKMNEPNELDKPSLGTGYTTYEGQLDVAYDTTTLETNGTVKELVDKIFDTWINDVFYVYGDSTKRFKEFLDEIVVSYNKAKIKKFEPAHIAAFNTFFQILLGGSTIVDTDPSKDKNVWAVMIDEITRTGKLESLKNKDGRINIKVVTDYQQLLKPYKKPPRDTKNLKAGIVFAFPKQAQNEFNNELKARPANLAAVEKNTVNTNNEKNFYKIREQCKTGAYKIDEEQVKQVLNFMKRAGPSVGIPYEDEYPDDADYTDNNKVSEKYDQFENIVKGYANTWARDHKGNYYTRIDDKGEIGHKFKIYGEDRVKEDVESFKSGTGNCGHLCIFADPNECNKFFEDMTKGKEITYERLAKMVNGNSFMKDFDLLKKNIVKVNPAFVIGTLRAFKFEKWEKLNADGTKTIKVESFSRWWKRVGQTFLDQANPKLVNSVAPTNKLGSNDYVGHNQKDKDGKTPVVPVPPQNLELFLKLLVSFITNNEFVLNPQSSQRIITNRLPITTSGPNMYGEEPEFITIAKNGVTKQVPNPAYGKVEEMSAPNLGKALAEIRKNGSFTPADPGLPENRSILNALWGLSIGVNKLGKMSFARPRTYTGLGYAGHFGGDGDLADNVKKFGPCARAAYDGLMHAKAVLKNKGKTIKEKEFDGLLNNVKELASLEATLYEKLSLIANYEKVINSLSDGDFGPEEVAMAEIEKTVKEYESTAKYTSSQSDAFTTKLMNIINSRTGSSSGYTGTI